MDVILIKDVDKVGRANTVVKVKEGYARNFLFPHNLAKPATAASLRKLEEEKKILSAQLAKIKAEAEVVRQRLDNLSLTIPALTQGEEKLYGGIHSHDISEALKREGFLVDKSSVVLDEPIKNLGIYEIPVRLHSEVTATIKVWVVKK
jgi:large subunit ribosomal protein L9